MRESKNVAIIEKIRWAVEHSERPIQVSNFPENKNTMVKNLWCFSEEGRQRNHHFKDAVSMVSGSDITRCYGWLKLDRKDLPRNFLYILARGNPYFYDYTKHSDYYYALVYEYVPMTEEIDLNVTNSNLIFFQRSGFDLNIKKPDNWRQGKLVDLGDITSPFYYIPSPLVRRLPRNINKFYPPETKLKPLDPHLLQSNMNLCKQPNDREETEISLSGRTSVQ
jgi:hypothetical protein